MLEFLLKLFVVILLTCASFSQAQGIHNTSETNRLDFFSPIRKVDDSSHSDGKKTTETEKPVHPFVASDSKANISEIMHPGSVETKPIKTVQSFDTIQGDSEELTQENLSDAKSNNNTTIVSGVNTVELKELERLPSNLKENEVNQSAQLDDSKKKQFPVDDKPNETIQMFDDAEGNEMLQTVNSTKVNDEGESPIDASKDEDKQLQKHKDEKGETQDSHNAGEVVNKLQSDLDDDSVKSPASYSDENDVDGNVENQTPSTSDQHEVEDNEAQSVSSDASENADDEPLIKTDVSNSRDDDEKINNIDNKKDFGDNADDEHALHDDKIDEDLPNTDVFSEGESNGSPSLPSNEEQLTSESGDWDLDSNMIPVDASGTAGMLSNEIDGGVSGDDTLVSDPVLPSTTLPNDLDDVMTSNSAVQGREKPHVPPTEFPQSDAPQTMSPPPKSSAAKVPPPLKSSTESTMVSSKPPLQFSKGAQTTTLSDTTVQNNETVPNSWLDSAKDYGKDVLDKYGMGQVVGIAMVVFFSLVLFLCCMCRCRTSRKYRRLRRMKDRGKEKDFLLTDKKSKGTYQSDRLTLLDETSEDDF